MCHCPSPGGEPLWNVYGHPRNFCLIAGTAEKCENRRLPRTTPERSMHLWPSIRLNPAYRAGLRWVIRGSRLLPNVSAVFAFRRNSRGDRAHAKAAPLSRRWEQTRLDNLPTLSRMRTRTSTNLTDECEGWLSFHAPDDEAFGFKCLPDLGDLVALDLDGAILHRTAGAARRAEFLCYFLDLRER